MPKKCRVCAQDKPLSEFYRKYPSIEEGNPSARNSVCRECQNGASKHRRATEEGYRESVNAKKRGEYSLRVNLRFLYGITLEQYNGMVERQGGVCAICGQPPTSATPGRRLHVDHDHKSGVIRGLLCGRCNTGIGSLQESPEILSRAILYLSAHES